MITILFILSAMIMHRTYYLLYYSQVIQTIKLHSQYHTGIKPRCPKKEMQINTTKIQSCYMYLSYTEQFTKQHTAPITYTGVI